MTDRALKVEVDADGVFMEIDHDGQGLCALEGSLMVRSFWACAHCGEATGGSRMACLDHPAAMRFLKYERFPAAHDSEEDSR